MSSPPGDVNVQPLHSNLRQLRRAMPAPEFPMGLVKAFGGPVTDQDPMEPSQDRPLPPCPLPA